MGGKTGSATLASTEIYGATNAFTFSVRGKSLVLSVQASGVVTVSDVAARLGATAAKKRKKLRQPLVDPSSASGDPPTITVPLSLTKGAKAALKRKGKASIHARITFAPQGGIARTETATLTIRGKKGKRKK